MLKNKYSSGELISGLVLGQPNHERQNISHDTKQMPEALLRRDPERYERESGKIQLIF